MFTQKVIFFILKVKKKKKRVCLKHSRNLNTPQLWNQEGIPRTRISDEPGKGT